MKINKIENIYGNRFEKWQHTLNFHVDYAKAKLFSYTRIISFGVNFVLNVHTFNVIVRYKFIRSHYHLKPFMCISVYVYHIKFLNKILEEIIRFGTFVASDSLHVSGKVKDQKIEIIAEILKISFEILGISPNITMF